MDFEDQANEQHGVPLMLPLLPLRPLVPVEPTILCRCSSVLMDVSYCQERTGEEGGGGGGGGQDMNNPGL